MQHWNLNQVHDRLRCVALSAIKEPEAVYDRQWYHREAKWLAEQAEVHGCTWETAAYVVAVLSPRVRWETQKTYTPSVFAALSRGATAMHLPGPGTHLCKRKAHRIWHGDLTALSGPKVEAFAQNLLLNEEHVTVDAIMQDVAVGSEPCTRDYLTPKRLRTIQQAVGLIGGELNVPPSQVQAMVWCWSRRLPF